MSKSLAAALGAIILSGCAAQMDAGMVCPNSDAQFGEEFRGAVYLFHNHHETIALVPGCPDVMLVAEAAMTTSEARRQFWDQVRSFETPTSRLPILEGDIRGTIERARAGTDLPVLLVSDAYSLKLAGTSNPLRQAMGPNPFQDR